MFTFLQRYGELTDAEAFRTFNMGIGLVIVCAPDRRDTLLAECRRHGEPGAAVIGRVTTGDGTVRYA